MTTEVNEISDPINTGEETSSLNAVLESTQTEADSNLNGNIDEMRSAFYETALNLFNAAKCLKPYDVLYTDSLLTQAQYFVSLADNYDTLLNLAKISSEMPLSKLPSKIPSSVVGKIDDYAGAITERMKNLKNKANVSEDVLAKVSQIADAFKEKLENK